MPRLELSKSRPIYILLAQYWQNIYFEHMKMVSNATYAQNVLLLSRAALKGVCNIEYILQMQYERSIVTIWWGWVTLTTVISRRVRDDLASFCMQTTYTLEQTWYKVLSYQL